MCKRVGCQEKQNTRLLAFDFVKFIDNPARWVLLHFNMCILILGICGMFLLGIRETAQPHMRKTFSACMQGSLQELLTASSSLFITFCSAPQNVHCIIVSYKFQRNVIIANIEFAIIGGICVSQTHLVRNAIPGLHDSTHIYHAWCQCFI